MADQKRVTTTTDNPAGSVEHSRGKAVWRWAREKLDSTSILLKRLDNPSLKLEEDADAEANGEDDPTGFSLAGEPQGEGGSFDPYNNKS